VTDATDALLAGQSQGIDDEFLQKDRREHAVRERAYEIWENEGRPGPRPLAIGGTTGQREGPPKATAVLAPPRSDSRPSHARPRLRGVYRNVEAETNGPRATVPA